MTEKYLDFISCKVLKADNFGQYRSFCGCQNII